jgi:hypothetical protein
MLQKHIEHVELFAICIKLCFSPHWYRVPDLFNVLISLDLLKCKRVIYSIYTYNENVQRYYFAYT